MTDAPKAEQGGSRWAKTLHDELGPELVRRWNEYEPMRAEIEQLKERVASLQASSGYEASIAQLKIERLTAALRELLEWFNGCDLRTSARAVEIAHRALEPKP